MSAGLPAHVRRDLDRAAAGIGRTPTAAHPDCICGKPIGSIVVRSLCDQDGEPYTRTLYGQRADCPQHGPVKP